jgi:hypothetical protein
MLNIPTFNVNSSFKPLSDSFSVDIINDSFVLNNDILRVNKLSFSLNSSYLDSFSVLDKNYLNILININVRIDYICNLNKVNCNIFSVDKIINICSGDDLHNKNVIIDSKILDADISSINSNVINMYILLLSSLT